MTKKEKIAFVCQRYGLDVSGGAEAYCRQIAEKLSDLYDVTVYTTCARDHIRWSNEYRPGNEIINEVHVKRYPSDQERDLSKFDEINKIVWPTPKNTFKNTGIVLVAMIIVGVVITALDAGLHFLLGFLMHVA